MKKNKRSNPFSHVHHIGMVVADINKTVKDLEALGIGRFNHPSLPGWLERRLFKGKTFDTRYKIPGIKPFVHPMMYKVIESNPSSSFADAGLPLMTAGRPDGNKPSAPGQLQENIKIFKAWLGDQIIEIIQPGTDTTSWGKHLKEKGEGIQHVGFQVDDVAIVQKLVENGATVLGGGIVHDNKGSFGYYLNLGSGLIIDIFKGYY